MSTAAGSAFVSQISKMLIFSSKSHRTGFSRESFHMLNNYAYFAGAINIDQKIHVSPYKIAARYMLLFRQFQH